MFKLSMHSSVWCACEHATIIKRFETYHRENKSEILYLILILIICNILFERRHYWITRQPTRAPSVQNVYV